jgi:hypothetical protein
MTKSIAEALTVIVAAVCLVRASVSGQAPAARPDWTPPRTLWGDPDISGAFTNKDEQGIPFERDPALGNQEFLTEEEFNARANAVGARVALEDADFDPDNPDNAPANRVWPTTAPPPHWGDRGKPTRRTSLVVDPPDGRIPPLTAEAKQRPQPRRRGSTGPGPFNSPEDLSFYDRCISRGLPNSMMPAFYGNSYEIVQGPGVVAIRYEMIHETRIIPLDHRPRVSTVIRGYMGDARGHWEGTTLVVETTNFRDELVYRNANAKTLRLIERFTRTAPDKVKWSVTVDDPTTWTKPWTFAVDLTQDSSQAPLEYSCHEGNYAMFNILSGARADDKAAKDAGKAEITGPPSR